MSNKLYEENDIQNIANAIRNKNGTEDTYKVSQMSTAINSIEVIEQATAEGENLSLANTKAMPYKDYKVKGKSEQTTKLIPEAYTPVEYITSDGSSYIETGLQITGDFEINLDFIRNSASSGEQPVASIWTSQYNYWNLYIKTNNVLEWYVAGHYIADNNALTQGVKNKVTLKRSGNDFTFKQNDSSTTFTYSNDNNTTTLKLFNRGDLNGSSTVSIGAVSIKKSNVLVMNLIPCYRNSDTVIGMYDAVNNQFYTNAGSGNFTKGNNVSTPSPDYPSEIHSVADDVNLFDVTSIPEWVGGSTSYSVNNNTLKVAGSWFVGYLLDVDKNTDYYFSNIKTIITSTVDTGKILVMDNSKNNVIKYIDNENEMTFNTGSYSQIYILFYCGGGNYGEVDFTNIKLQKGSTPTSYSLYNQGTVTIKQRGTTESNDYTIQTSPLRSLPNGVKDTIEAEQHRRILQVDMGELTWVYFSGRFYSISLKEKIKGNSGGSIVSNVMCDIYNAITPASWYTKSEIGIAIGGSGYGDPGSILVYDSNYTSKSSFETAMQGHYLICELEEEIIEPLTQNQATTMLDIIKTGSYENTTNIYTDEDVKPTIGVGYYKKG